MTTARRTRATVGRLVLASVLWATLGVAVGLAVGHQMAAIVGVDAVDLLAPGIAMAVLAGWAAVAVVTPDRLMRSRDIA